jgi:hypothetical protein
MTQANEPPNAQNDTGDLVVAGVALLMLLALLYAAWLYFDWEGGWSH